MNEPANNSRGFSRYIGATVIATIVFFVLNFLGSTWLEGKGTTVALLDALWKAGVFGVIFHVLHNVVARLFRWYQN